VSVGKILEKEWSGLIHPATKAEALDRVDKLARAVKKARARANDSDLDVAADRIGKRVQMLRRVCVMSLADAGTVLIKDGQAKHAKGLLVNAERVQFHKNVQTSLSQITQALMREPEAQNEAKKADTNRALLDCKTRNAEGKLNPAHYSCGDVFAAAVAICSLYLIASSIAAARCTAAAIYGYNACTVKVENGSEG
jgi:hypothetical protein